MPVTPVAAATGPVTLGTQAPAATQPDVFAQLMSAPWLHAPAAHGTGAAATRPPAATSSRSESATDAPAATDEVETEDHDTDAPAATSAPEPSPAQIIAAAQVVPVAPVLAGAPALEGTVAADAVPSTSVTAVSAPVELEGTAAAAGAPGGPGTAGSATSMAGPTATANPAATAATSAEGHPDPEVPALPAVEAASGSAAAAEPTRVAAAETDGGSGNASSPAGTAETQPTAAVTAPSGEPAPAQGQPAATNQGTAPQAASPAGSATGDPAVTDGPEAVDATTGATDGDDHPAVDPGADPAADPAADGATDGATSRGTGGAASNPGAQPAADSSSAQPAQPGAAPTLQVGLGSPATLTGSGQVAGQPTGQQQVPVSTVNDQVLGQLSGEVGRLVSRGDGTRRITVNLQPEALGDVRVVLTVRRGEVHVRMAGGDVAQQALLRGAPELHRLLEAAGATASQVVVGDSASSSRSGLLDGGLARDGRQGSDAAGDGTTPQHSSARKRDGDTSATDGLNGGTRPRSSIDDAAGPFGRGGSTRTLRGVDVTM